LELPTDRPRPAARSHRGAVLTLELAPETAGELAALGHRVGATPFMVFLAAFQLMLARFTGQDDVVVGSPVAGRGQRETEELIGLFVNPLAMRTDLSGDPTFLALLARVRETTLGAYAHQNAPFERLVDALRVERRLNHSPVFQAQLAYQNVPAAALELPGVTVEPIAAQVDASKLDLSLSVVEEGGVVRLRLRYDVELFEADTAGRMLEAVGRILHDAARAPELPVSLIAPPELAESFTLPAAADGAAPLPEGDTVLDLWAAWVGATPDAVALVCEGERLTFGAVDERAGRVAAYLRRRGIGVGDRVGLCVERSAGMIVGLLGILKAGAAYVPLDPTYPEERQAFMLRDSGAVLLLAGAGAAVAGSGVERVELAAAWATPGGVAPAAVPPASLAYVIYTSGSTGRPKGVGVEHRQLLAYVRGVAARLALPAGAAYATVSTIAADLGNTAIFPSLCGGGSLHVISDARIGDADSFTRYLAREAIDALKITPSHLAALMGGRDPAGALPRRC
ncbi:MAG TPA: AMP-binding protein, partial [Longimicrobium sp.]|nr:AMP-binding protein [Longimicrobium sp.]